MKKVIEHHDGQTRYGELKKEVAEQVRDFIADFQASLQDVDDTAVLSKLESSEHAMREQAAATLLKVQQAVGLRYHAA